MVIPFTGISMAKVSSNKEIIKKNVEYGVLSSSTIMLAACILMMNLFS